MRFLAGLAIYLLAGGLVWAATGECSYCHKKLGAKYLETADGRTFCSRKCYEQTLPHCKVCGKLLNGASIRSGKDYYCSQQCFETQLPVCRGCGRHAAHGVVFKAGGPDMFYCDTCAALPKCFSCMLPAIKGTALADGRVICARCKEESVWTQEEAERLFEAVRKVLREQFDLSTRHRIKLRLIDLPSMQRRSPDYSPGMEMGLFVFDATINTVQKDTLTLTGIKTETETYRSDVSYTIFGLTGTPRSKLIEVFAHELGHDWMQEYYPGVKALKIREGVAEYCSYVVNLQFKQGEMNLRMKNNPDPIYGDGFRLIYKVGGERGDFSAVRRFLRQNER